MGAEVTAVGCLGAAVPLLRPGYLCYKYCAPAQPPRKLCCMFPLPQQRPRQLCHFSEIDGHEPCALLVAMCRRRTADSAVHRYTRAPHDCALNTGATRLPRGEDLGSAVLQAHTAAQLEVSLTVCACFQMCTVGLFECNELRVLFAGARPACS